MKILLVTQWCPPEPAKLLTDMAQSAMAAGHEITLLTGFPNYPMGKLYPGYRIRLWQREIIDGIPVIRVPLYPEHSRSAWRRVVNYMSFALSAALLGPWLVPKVDVVHFYHPPLTSAIPAWLISRLRRVPMTCEIQDMWPETLAATGMLNNPHALAMVGRYARWVFRKAAAIRVISAGFRKNLIAKGVSSEKIHVISNWVDGDFYRPREPNLERAKQLGLAEHFNVMFAGTMGLAQGLDVVLDAAHLLRDLPQIQFVLVGDGADSDRLQQIVAQRGLTNVKFLGRYPGEQMPDLYALADVLLIHLRDDPLFRITIPHKIFTYLASAKPILAALEGDPAEVVRAAEAGVTCRPSDPQAMADAVRRLYGMPPSERHALGRRGCLAVNEHYGREHLVSQVLEMLQSAIDAGKKKSPAP